MACKSGLSRLAKLANLSSRTSLLGERARLRIRYAILKTLPDDYTGPRHVVTVKQPPPGPGGEDWYEWEKRPGPGPEPAANATGPNDEIVVQVHYVDGKPKA